MNDVTAARGLDIPSGVIHEPVGCNNVIGVGIFAGASRVRQPTLTSSSLYFFALVM